MRKEKERLSSRFFVQGLVLTLTLGSGCTTTSQSSRQVSLIDQTFIFDRQVRKKQEGLSVGIYRQVVAPVLSTHCKWFPSDSNYAVWAQAQCGPLRGSLMAISRFLFEEDAGYMGYPIINNRGHIEYVSYPTDCSL